MNIWVSDLCFLTAKLISKKPEKTTMEGFLKGTVRSTENTCSLNIGKQETCENLVLVFTFMFSEKNIKLVAIKEKRELLNWRSCQWSSCTSVVTIKLRKSDMINWHRYNLFLVSIVVAIKKKRRPGESSRRDELSHCNYHNSQQGPSHLINTTAGQLS